MFDRFVTKIIKSDLSIGKKFREQLQISYLQNNTQSIIIDKNLAHALANKTCYKDNERTSGQQSMFLNHAMTVPGAGNWRFQILPLNKYSNISTDTLNSRLRFLIFDNILRSYKGVISKCHFQISLNRYHGLAWIKCLWQRQKYLLIQGLFCNSNVDHSRPQLYNYILISMTMTTYSLRQKRGN